MYFPCCYPQVFCIMHCLNKITKCWNIISVAAVVGSKLSRDHMGIGRSIWREKEWSKYWKSEW